MFCLQCYYIGHFFAGHPPRAGIPGSLPPGGARDMNDGGEMMPDTIIARLKDVERTLQEQLRFLQLMIDTIPMPVFYKDLHGVYLGCNKAFEEFLGVPKDRLIGKTAYDVAPKEL